ncbi:MAG: YhfC family intramembrane metalloprotease [Clostridiaceae bacterium]
MVSGASMAAMGFSFLLATAVPVAAAVWCLKKYKNSIKNIIVGAAMFVIFALILERSMHIYFLKTNFEISMILENPWIFGLYGGLAAGIFEEFGRFFGYKLLLKGRTAWKDGVAYGIGHGGIEAILVGGLSAAQSLYLSYLINMGSLPAALEQIRGILTVTEPYLFMVSGIERMFALALQIALSILVLYAVRTKKLRYLFYAVIIHAAIDFPAALFQKGIISNVWTIEAALAVIAAISLFFIVRSQKMFKSDIIGEETK